MKNTFLFLVLISIITISLSCRKDFNTVANFGKLEFSSDTIFLDTIFSKIGSATYNLKVYNRSNKAITIPEIKLENGNTSKYRLNVDGESGKNFSNIDILAKDSLFIFVETTVDVSTVINPLYTDKILFDNGNQQQNVNLVTLIQDAHLLFPPKKNTAIIPALRNITFDNENIKIQARFLTDSELNFTAEKPYIIYGYMAVPAGKTLHIDAGSNIYFHKNSGLLIGDNASLKINGTLDKKVTFQGDRLAHMYNEIPGQWGCIWLGAGSLKNEIHHAIIKNGSIGLLVDAVANENPALQLENTEIYNHSNYGILARNTHLKAANLVIGNAGKSSLACIAGGNYSFTHSTFANYWNNSLRQNPTVLISNYQEVIQKNQQENQEKKTDLYNLYSANFVNCIIEGNGSREFITDKKGDYIFKYAVENSMLRFYNFDTSVNSSSNYKNIILNGTPDFKAMYSNNFSIGEYSDAINKAKKTAISKDILGVSRNTTPDIGAYQHIIFDEK
ncbi:hypothetical protein [Tenacibaculum piscium]|uniref:hypothetical protein n=1 Tax=Tenacibaculum piscium TaxID=1458515 RepID=UPI00187B46C5|nr:hypothetical protein [Tenacibaculum piscium]MBE7689770.1 hypothetical protein [Tenacibaculum piscium]